MAASSRVPCILVRPAVLGQLARRVAVVALGLAAATHAHAAGVLELLGKGVQVYRCAEASGGFAWTLKGPEATLLTPAGKIAGRHFAGPSWQAADGSTVVGEVVASGSAPNIGGHAGAIPWLVLRAASHTGSGTFETVTYVTRSRTVGGVAPATGCDAAHVGTERRIAYSATYTFFGVQ